MGVSVMIEALQSVTLNLMCSVCINATEPMFLVKELLIWHLTGLSSLSVP